MLEWDSEHGSMGDYPGPHAVLKGSTPATPTGQVMDDIEPTCGLSRRCRVPRSTSGCGCKAARRPSSSAVTGEDRDGNDC